MRRKCVKGSELLCPRTAIQDLLQAELSAKRKEVADKEAALAAERKAKDEALAAERKAKDVALAAKDEALAAERKAKDEALAAEREAKDHILAQKHVLELEQQKNLPRMERLFVRLTFGAAASPLSF